MQVSRLPVPGYGPGGKKWIGICWAEHERKLFCAPFDASDVLVIDVNDPADPVVPEGSVGLWNSPWT